MTLKKNQEIPLKLTKWAPKALATGDHKGTPVQVPYTIPGEEITAHITKATSRLAYGKCQTILKESPKRVTPKCNVFKKCGGCSLQHLSYDAQLESKKDQVIQLFKQAKIPFPNPEIIPSPPYNYRNKSQFSIAKSITGKVEIGLSAPRSQRIIDTERCEIAHPLTNQVLPIIRDFLNTHDVPIFNPKTQTGGISHLITRVGEGNNDLMVALSSNESELPHEDSLIDALKTIPEFKSLILNHNPNPEWQVLGPKETCLWGTPQISMTISGIKTTLSLQSFFQINSTQIPKMWTQIAEMLSIQKTEILCDLYCGTGALTLFLAQKCQEIIGIESHPDAIQNANENAKLNQIKNAKFQQGDVTDLTDLIPKASDALILDPPRKGLSPQLIQSLIPLNIPKLLLISCAPESLLTDIAPFLDSGYKITQTALIDLFSQTHHVETVTLLKKMKLK